MKVIRNAEKNVIYYIRDRSGFLTLLEIILVLVIILVLYYIGVNFFFRKPTLNEKTKESLSELNIDTSSYRSILDNTKEKIEDVNKLMLNSEKRYENLE